MRLAGAYNQPYVFYSQYENQVVPVSLPTISDDGPTVTDQAWNIDWSQQNKTLMAFFKGGAWAIVAPMMSGKPRMRAKDTCGLCLCKSASRTTAMAITMAVLRNGLRTGPFRQNRNGILQN